jgi:hypothetical protein
LAALQVILPNGQAYQFHLNIMLHVIIIFIQEQAAQRKNVGGGLIGEVSFSCFNF